MSTAALAIVTNAYNIVGMTGEGSSINDFQKQQGLTCLNQILGQWSLMPLTIPVTSREVFPLSAGKGGPSDPYTIGPGGDFDTSRPPEIDNVGLLVTNVVQPFEITRTLYTNDAYASIVQKELTSSYFAGLYYNATFTGGLGTIQLWPVPSATGTSLVLYRPAQLRTFATIATAYDLPPGAQPALEWDVAAMLSDIAGQTWTESKEKRRLSFLATYQRGNTSMTDLGMDPALTSTSGVYNILSDSLNGFRGN